MMECVDRKMQKQALNFEGIILSLIRHPNVICRVDQGDGIIGYLDANVLLTEHTLKYNMYDILIQEEESIHKLPLHGKLVFFKGIVKVI